MEKKILTLKELAVLTDSKLVGDPKHQITNVADLETADSQDASFLSNSQFANSQYEQAMLQSKAGVVFVTKESKQVEGRNFLINDNPSRAFQLTLEAFLGTAIERFSGFAGIHPTAVVHETAKLGEGVTIGPHAVIDEDVVIGSNVTISAGCYVGLGVVIGTDSFLHPKVIIRERCHIGNRVILQPGVVVGSCGFGYTSDAKGHKKLNQVGTVIIEDDVEIGANTTIDRSRFKSTIVGRGTKIDNLVQIAHGVVIGEHNIIVSQTGIAGSTTTGNFVVIGGQVAVTGHIAIADGVMIAARSGISKSIEKAGKYGGVPAIPLKEHQKISVLLRNIEGYVVRIKALEKDVERLKSAKTQP